MGLLLDDKRGILWRRNFPIYHWFFWEISKRTPNDNVQKQNISSTNQQPRNAWFKSELISGCSQTGHTKLVNNSLIFWPKCDPFLARKSFLKSLIRSIPTLEGCLKKTQMVFWKIQLNVQKKRKQILWIYLKTVLIDLTKSKKFRRMLKWYLRTTQSINKIEKNEKKKLLKDLLDAKVKDIKK